MKRFLKWIPIMALLVSCSSEPKPDVTSDDAISDALISFYYNAQGGRYSDALEYLTYDDQLRIIDGNGNVKEEYKLAMTRVKLSALQKIPFSLDMKGRLEGMVAVLDDANRKFTMSEQQRATNLDRVEKKRSQSDSVSAVAPVVADTAAAPASNVVPPSPESNDEKPLTVDEYLK